MYKFLVLYNFKFMWRMGNGDDEHPIEAKRTYNDIITIKSLNNNTHIYIYRYIYI